MNNVATFVIRNILTSLPQLATKKSYRDVLFEFHLKFWKTASIGIPVKSLL